MEEVKEINFEITDQAINESITHEQFMQMGFGTTVCLLIVQDGLEVVGSFAPISEKITYDEAKKNARANAIIGVRRHLESVAKFRRAVYLQEEANKQQKEKAEAVKSSPAPQPPTDVRPMTQKSPPDKIPEAVIVEDPAPSPATITPSAKQA